MRKFRLLTLLGITAIQFAATGTPLLYGQSPAINGALLPYTACQFTDGLQIVHLDTLPPGVTSRGIDTDSGPRQIDLQAGVRIMFAYPDTDFYANTKAELLAARNYPQLKQSLLDNFQYLLHGNTLNTAMHSPMNGLEVRGLDREKLEGGVLGIYLFFDDSAHVVTTIYLLNQEPQSRKFQTIEEYRSLRDRFLASYTACIQSNLKHPF
jgi:hypothetical protein